MVINIVVIVFILGMAGLWLSRGFFSAIINLLAVLLAGGVAFAVWEPLAYKILESTDDRSFLQGAAWSFALAGPFILSLGIFRLILDVILRANIKVSTPVNYAGGAVCGALAGFISAGIAVLSVGFLRLDAGLWQTTDNDPSSGYLNVEYDSNGSMKPGKDLWIPADKMVAAFYSTLARTTFYVNKEQNLATLYPDLAYVPTTLRYNYGLGKGRNTTRPKDFVVMGRYSVGKDKKLSSSDLLGDKWMPAEQRVTLFKPSDDNNAVPAGSYLEGFIIRFNSTGKELGGDAKVAVGNAQLRLLATNAEGKFLTLFPIAVAAQGEADKPAFQRFRFDGKDIFIASVGGASEAYFGFDFVMPPGFTPQYLYVKNIRHTVGEEKSKKPVVFAGPADRDEAISAGRLLGGSANEPMDSTNVVQVRFDAANPSNFPITITNSPGQVLNKMVIRSMTMNDDNKITDGEQDFTQDELKNYASEKSLRVDGFISSSDTVNVQVDVSLNSKACWLNHPKASLQDDQPPILVDSNGVHYEPIGYIYDNKGSGLTRIRYTPGAFIHTLKELPTVSRSKPTDTLKLIYRISDGVKIQYFGVGTEAVIEVKPPMDIKKG